MDLDVSRTLFKVALKELDKESAVKNSQTVDGL
jgi:hypothetical protein